MKEAKENQEASDLKYWKEVRIWFFRVLKWLALAWAILIGIIMFASSSAPSVTIAAGEAQWAMTLPLVLLAIFFHLEQHKS